MEEFQNVMEFHHFDLWNVIQHSLALAHTDHYDQLRLRREHFVELMYAPRPRQSSDVGVVCNFSSNQTGAESGMYNEAVGEESQHVRDEYEDALEMEEGEYREEQEIMRVDESEGDKLTAQDVALKAFDDNVEALQDDKERKDLFRKEIDSIRDTIENVRAKHHLPKDVAMKILGTLHELTINAGFYEVLQEGIIGKLIARMSRKHPDIAVKDKACGLVTTWKALVEKVWARRELADAASVHDESGPVSEEEVALPTPPLDDGGRFASVDVKISEILNFSESAISATAGPSSASKRPFGVSHSRRTSGSSSEGNSVARVDKHGPTHTEGNPNLDELNAYPIIGNIKKGRKAPSERGPTQLRANKVITSAPVSKHELAPTPREMLEGMPREMEHQGTTGNAGLRKSDALPKPTVGTVKLRIINKGLATRVEPLPRDVNATVVPVPTNINAAIVQSKRKLQEGYAKIENAKKSRVVRRLPLRELPEGGPKPSPKPRAKAQRPGHRNWVKALLED